MQFGSKIHFSPKWYLHEVLRKEGVNKVNKIISSFSQKMSTPKQLHRMISDRGNKEANILDRILNRSDVPAGVKLRIAAVIGRLRNPIAHYPTMEKLEAEMKRLDNITYTDAASGQDVRLFDLMKETAIQRYPSTLNKPNTYLHARYHQTPPGQPPSPLPKLPAVTIKSGPSLDPNLTIPTGPAPPPGQPPPPPFLPQPPLPPPPQPPPGGGGQPPPIGIPIQAVNAPAAHMAPRGPPTLILARAWTPYLEPHGAETLASKRTPTRPIFSQAMQRLLKSVMQGRRGVKGRRNPRI